MEESNLRLIVLGNCQKLGKLVNEHLKLIRKTDYNFIVPVKNPIFANSESKALIEQTVRAKDVFIIGDIGNYEQTYKMYGKENRKSYNDNFMDIVNTIDACAHTPERIWVIEPLLYGSRQHKREGRESLNCAIGLRILESMGIKGVISYDVHDPTVRSALSNASFDNLYPTNTMLNHFLNVEDIDFNNLVVINPDAGATKRANHFGRILESPTGGFSKLRDTSKVVDGTCQILKHEYTGKVSLQNKNLLVVDDIIASGQSMIDVAEAAKYEGANKIFLFSTFGLFSDGEKSIESFNTAYKKGFIDKVYITNLSYIPEEIAALPWVEIVDCSHHLAKVIHTLNKNESIEPLMNGKEQISQKVLNKKIESKTKFY